MPKEEQEHQQTQKQESVSAFRNAKEIKARAARKAELKEREKQAAAEEAAYQAREEYAKELQEEKIDLIRLKQGVIEDSDKIFSGEEEQKKYTIFQKIGNWFYHSKWWLGIAAFCTLVVGFLIYDYVTRDDPDLLLLLLTDNPYVYAGSEDLCKWVAESCDDFNGDGEILVQSVYIPVSKSDMEQGGTGMASINSQLMIQFESASCMLVLADEGSEEYVDQEYSYQKMSELYPDCPLADGYELHICGTEFEKQLHLPEPLDETSYLAIRAVRENMNSLEENQEAYDRAKIVLDRLIPRLTEADGEGETENAG